MATERKKWSVTLLATEDTYLSPLLGMLDVFRMSELIRPDNAVFEARVAGETNALKRTASGLPLQLHARIEDIDSTDIAIVASTETPQGRWRAGRYAGLVEWMRRQHSQGALLCSACSGVLLLAETGLLDGWPATLHWSVAETFQQNFPDIELHLAKELVIAGEQNELIMSGGSSTWHDLALYLISRLAGPATAREISRYFLLQWHRETQAPYLAFFEPTEHGDAAILSAQSWLRDHCSASTPVEQARQVSGLGERSFKRRFQAATGHTPIAYVQQLRVHEAKRLLETGNTPIDEISAQVGYEDPAFFRRLFKRIVGINPSAYRRKFQLPAYIESAQRDSDHPVHIEA